MQDLSSSGVVAGMFMIDKKDSVQVIDFVSQQRRIFIRCRQFIFPIVKPFVFDFDKIGSIDYFYITANVRMKARKGVGIMVRNRLRD